MPKENDDQLLGIALLGAGGYALSRFLGGGGGGGGDEPEPNTAAFNVQNVEGLRAVVNSTPSTGDIDHYEWTWGDGSGTQFEDPGDEQTGHDYASGGTYTITLTVVFTDGSSDSTAKEVTVSEVSPTAAINASRNGFEVTATASASTDPQGDIVEYQWNWGDGTIETTTSATNSHTYATEGTFTVSVSVIDAQGNTGLASTTVTPSNLAPSAALSVSTSGYQLTATASGSTDPEGNITEYAWNFGDGTQTTTSDPTVQHTYDHTGQFDVCVTVRDAYGGESSTCRTATVANTAPDAAMTLSTSGLELTATASASTDAQDNIAFYEWEFGDGTTAQTDGPTVQHTYENSGQYNVCVTVYDEASATDTACRTANVEKVGMAPSVSVSLFTGNLEDATDISVAYSDDRTPVEELTSTIEWYVNGDKRYTLGPEPADNLTSFSMGWNVIGADVGDRIQAVVTVEDADGWQTTGSAAKDAEQPGNDNGGGGQSYDHELVVTPMARTSDVAGVPLNMSISDEVTMSPGSSPEDYTNGSIGGQVATTLEPGNTYTIEYNGEIEGMEWSNTTLQTFLDGEAVDPFELTDDAGPRVSWYGGDGSEVIEATIRVTEELYYNNGLAPARAAAEWIGGALELRDISHDILYDFEPISVPTERAVCFNPYITDGDTVTGTRDDACRAGDCSDLSCCSENDAIPSTHVWWYSHARGHPGATASIEQFNEDFDRNYGVEGYAYTMRKDSNLLLTNAQGGGCAFVGGNIGAAGASRITEYREYDPATNEGSWYSGMWTVMHEFGHNMGYSHPLDTCDEAGGSAENGSATQNLLDGYWYATPCNPNQNLAPCTNKCGRLYPKREDPERMYRMYYTPCTAGIFRNHTGSAQGQAAQSFSADRGTPQWPCDLPGVVCDNGHPTLPTEAQASTVGTSGCGCSHDEF